MITHKFRLYLNKNQEQKLLENLDKYVISDTSRKPLVLTRGGIEANI